MAPGGEGGQELAGKVMTNIMRSQEGTKEDEFKYVMGEEERQRMFNILWKENLNKLLHLQYQLSNLV